MSSCEKAKSSYLIKFGLESRFTWFLFPLFRCTFARFVAKCQSPFYSRLRRFSSIFNQTNFLACPSLVHIKSFPRTPFKKVWDRSYPRIMDSAAPWVSPLGYSLKEHTQRMGDALFCAHLIVHNLNTFHNPNENKLQVATLRCCLRSLRELSQTL
jgi:hypothetical protein